MKFKYLYTLLQSQEKENAIVCIALAPNNKKIAVATSERSILLFDDLGEKKDKFNTKPAVPEAGKKSYSITCLSFGKESDILAIGQTDNIIFVYRIGDEWNSKKVICNKFSLSAPCTSISWLASTMLLCGSLDGKIRFGNCKTNKTNGAWSGSSGCISLTPIDNSCLSGHVDGSILNNNGRLFARHPVPPVALCTLENAILAAGCDKRIVIYDNSGRLLTTFDYRREATQQDFTSACSNSTGQAAVVGSFDRCHVIEWSNKDSQWKLCKILNFTGFYSIKSVSWSNDGGKISICGFSGIVVVYEAMMKRWKCGNGFEAIRRGPGQVTLKSLENDNNLITVQTTLGKDIHSIKIMGNDKYAVCRTDVSLIVCDFDRSLSSEIPWSGTNERFNFQHAPVCMIHKAGELSIIEYGINSVLASVRTEFVNPHLISVRINEGDSTISKENKKLAYLLDKRTICVVDLITGGQVAQARLESKVDWLELNESAEILLLRDRQQHLIMLDIPSGKTDIILSKVSYVQWVEGSDAVIAQTKNLLAVWYSIYDVGSVELLECSSGMVTGVELKNDKHIIKLEGGPVSHITLDTSKLKFCKALKSKDFKGCETYLEGLGENMNAENLWLQLANKSMEINDINLAIRCWRALGDEGRSVYLEETLKLVNSEEDENKTNISESPIVKIRLAILSSNLKVAEQTYIDELKNPTGAIEMYTKLHRWKDALSVADKYDPITASTLKNQYMDHLISSGAEGEAVTLLLNNNDSRGALQLALKAGLTNRAARILKDTPTLMTDTNFYNTVLHALIQKGNWETAAELCENGGDPQQAVELYAKAKSFAKAIQRARAVCPGDVTDLERRWGEHLIEQRQWGSAVTHLIEAGDSRAALSAAIKAQHWPKAIQIIQVIDDVESVQEHYEALANHFVLQQDWDTAEALWQAGNLIQVGAQTLINMKQWNRALAFTTNLLGNEQAALILKPHADHLKDTGNYKEAENLYIGLGSVETAIAMYEETGKHAALLRLIAKYRPQLLSAAQKRIAQNLSDEGKPHQAEHYYIASGDWKAAIQMYRALNEWEDAYKVAMQHAPPQIQEQVIVAWSNSIEDDAAAARLLSSKGVIEAGIRWALRGGRWTRALALCHIGAPHLEAPVRAQMAAHLEDQGQLDEAEAEFIRGGGVEEAIEMWLHAQQYARALALAEQHAPHKEAEVLQQYAQWAENQGDLPLYEALVIRSGRPQEIIKYYKENGFWDDALRVCEEYMPQAVKSLKIEASNNGNYDFDTGRTFSNPEEILQAASEYTKNGEYYEAIQALLSVDVESVGSETVERVALRAARLARDHLSPNEIKKVAPLIAQRMAESGQESLGMRLQNALMKINTEDTGHENISGAGESMDNTHIEQMIRRGEWLQALEISASADTSLTARIASRFATLLLDQPDSYKYRSSDGSEILGGPLGALAVLNRWGGGDNSIISLINPLLARISALPSPGFHVYRDLRNVIHSIVSHSTTYERNLQATALLCVREACKHVSSLKPLALRASTAVLRYTDIIAADNAFLEAGKLLRALDRKVEALVLLNRYLDLAELAEVDGADVTTLDHSDFEETDFPQDVLLGGTATNQKDHDEIKEWVLAVSLDQNVTQALPIDKRGLYECCLHQGESPCALTGFPLSTRVVHFTNGRCVNRDAWAKVQVQSNAEPASDIADCRRFITSWCGADDYNFT